MEGSELDPTAILASTVRFSNLTSTLGFETPTLQRIDFVPTEVPKAVFKNSTHYFISDSLFAPLLGFLKEGNSLLVFSLQCRGDQNFALHATGS